MLDDTKLEYLTNTLPVLKTLYMYTNCCGGTRNKKLTEYLKKVYNTLEINNYFEKDPDKSYIELNKYLFAQSMLLSKEKKKKLSVLLFRKPQHGGL